MGGGGGGDGRYSGPTPERLQRKINETRERARESLNTEINELLDRLLAHFNDRDTEDTSQKLDSIKEILGEDVQIETILFGGSVAKHTDVSGLSDVDALVILEREDLQGKSASELLNEFHKILDETLPRNEVRSVRKGKLAVTASYYDDTEIQLLPALRSGQTISIAASDGTSWNDTRPKVFERQLSRANARLNYSLVPAIKLMKSIVSDFPAQKQISGYHLEALALNASSGYSGPKNPRSVLLHLLGQASQRVLKPIKDATGQSRLVDSYLGEANSIERRNASQALAGMKRRLESATTLGQWRGVLEE